MIFRIIGMAILGLCVSCPILGQHKPPIVLTDSLSSYNISNSIEIFVDHDQQLTFEDILSGKYDDHFVKNDRPLINLGNVQATVWHKFSIDMSEATSKEWFLILDNHHLDSITLYTPKTDSGYSQVTSGRLTSYNDREYTFNTYVFLLSNELVNSNTYYLKVSSYLLRYPLLIVNNKAYSSLQLKRSIAIGILIGFFIMIVTYNLIIYRTERSRNYVYYLIYVFISVIKICDINGYMDVVWQGPLALMKTQAPGITVLLGLSMIFFTVNILDFRKNLPIANKLLIIFFTPPLILSVAFNIADNKLYTSIINQYASLAVMLFLYVCAIIIYRRGYITARFYIIAVTAFFLSFIAYALTLLGLFPENDFTNNLVQYGSAMEMLLFSMALGDKVRLYKKEKHLAEKGLIQSLQENERLIVNQNKMLEIKVAERTHDLEVEKEKSDNLLLNILPGEIAEELKAHGASEARYYENTSILFTDFVNFTGASEKLSPTDLVKEIHYYFTNYDRIVEEVGLEKIKTIGDAYLAACGLPVPDKDHAIKIIQGAFKIRQFTADYYNNGGAFQVRIGVHSGPLVAGIVGTKKFAYDIWGDTVNTAARMEQNSEIGKINISESTYLLIKDKVRCISRGKRQAKNKGEIEMYFAEELLYPEQINT